MLTLLYINDKPLLKMSKDKRQVFYKIAGLLGAQFLLFLLVATQTKFQLGFRLSLGLVFLLTYFLIFRKSILNIKLPVN